MEVGGGGCRNSNFSLQVKPVVSSIASSNVVNTSSRSGGAVVAIGNAIVAVTFSVRECCVTASGLGGNASRRVSSSL